MSDGLGFAGLLIVLLIASIAGPVTRQRLFPRRAPPMLPSSSAYSASMIRWPIGAPSRLSFSAFPESSFGRRAMCSMPASAKSVRPLIASIALVTSALDTIGGTPGVRGQKARTGKVI